MTDVTAFSTPRLTGRRALVTGSTSGIGRSIALALAGEGAAVVVSGRNTDAGTAVVEEVRSAGGAAHFVHADLSGEGRPRSSWRRRRARRSAARSICWSTMPRSSSPRSRSPKQTSASSTQP